MALVRRQTAELPLVVLVTTVILGVPLAVLWLLSVTEIVRSLAALGAIAVVLAFGLARGGEALARRIGRQLSELMLWGWLRSFFYERRLDRAWTEINEAGELSAAEMAERFRELSAALEAADGYTSGHSRRVAHCCERIARKLELGGAEISRLRIAAAVHDVGKVNTPPEILRKPAPLTAEEYETIKLHCAEGAEMVARLADPRLTDAVRHHHERIDGSGYPDGLTAAEIPLEARIIAVADTFDAITSSRPYRPARSRRAALEILRAEAGTKLDADAVRALSSPSMAVVSALTSVPERGIAAMGGALNTVSASTAAVIVAVIALLGIGVTNPSSVAGVVNAIPLPGVIDALVPGGGEQNSPRVAAAKPDRTVSDGARPGHSGRPAPLISPQPAPAPSQPAAPPDPAGGKPGPPLQVAPPVTGLQPPAGTPAPTPQPEPPGPPGLREPELLDPVTDALPPVLGNALKSLTDPLLPPR